MAIEWWKRTDLGPGFWSAKWKHREIPASEQLAELGAPEGACMLNSGGIDQHGRFHLQYCMIECPPDWTPPGWHNATEDRLVPDGIARGRAEYDAGKHCGWADHDWQVSALGYCTACRADEREAAKREQQAARFDADPGDCDDGSTLEKLGSLADEIRSISSQIRAAMFPLAADAGSIGDTRSDRRRAWDALDERRQEDVQQAVAEILVGMRHEPLEQRIDAVINAVLDA